MEWFFNAREGIFGPYNTKKMAEEELHIFTERRKLAEDEGGRNKAKKKDKLTLAPMEHELATPVFFDYAKRKKGLDE